MCIVYSVQCSGYKLPTRELDVIRKLTNYEIFDAVWLFIFFYFYKLYNKYYIAIETNQTKN